MENAGSKPKSRVGVFLFGALAGGLLAVLFVSLGIVGGLNRALSGGLENILRSKVFADSKTSFGAAGVQLLKGRVFLKDVNIARVSSRGSPWTLTVKEVSTKVPVRSLLFRGRVSQQLRIDRPNLEVSLSAAESAREPATKKSNVESSPFAALSWLGRLPLSKISLIGGGAHFVNPAGEEPIHLSAINVRIERPQPDSRAISVQMNGRLDAQEPGSLSLRASFQQIGSLCDSEGDLKLDDLPIPDIARFFSPDPEIRFARGRITLNTHFTCKEDWVTASHHVEIKDFRLDVSEKKKDVFGIPVKYAQSLFSIDYLSFVVPMSGSIQDPHIGIRSSIEQIMLKILQEKYDDPEKAEKLAKRGGEYFGKKIEKAIKKALKKLDKRERDRNRVRS